MIPADVQIKKGQLPDEPGVYFYYDKNGTLLYIGKATSLKRRVGSYFTKSHNQRIAELVSKIARIEYIETPTVIEALVLEANKIREHQPPYNVRQKDDKSFTYLVITNEPYPRPLIMRGLELSRMGVNPLATKLPKQVKDKYSHIFGPFTSARSLRMALDLLRKSVPWSTCEPDQKRPCFYAQIGKCPGVCTRAITSAEYKKHIRELILFFQGKKTQLIRRLRKQMESAAEKHEFERAASLRNRLFSLEHIRDVSLITREEVQPLLTTEDDYIDLNGRIEAYDISNTSGTSAVGSMVVFEEGRPAKDKYRKFKIKTVEGPNDVGMMEEMMRRRLKRAQQYQNAWPLPEIMVIDGGKGQVERVREVMKELGVSVPVIGIAKGFDRKQDRLVFSAEDAAVASVAHRGKPIFQAARDEAHRFAVKYHRALRSKRSMGTASRSKRKKK